MLETGSYTMGPDFLRGIAIVATMYGLLALTTVLMLTP